MVTTLVTPVSQRRTPTGGDQSQRIHACHSEQRLKYLVHLGILSGGSQNASHHGNPCSQSSRGSRPSLNHPSFIHSSNHSYIEYEEFQTFTSVLTVLADKSEAHPSTRVAIPTFSSGEDSWSAFCAAIENVTETKDYETQCPLPYHTIPGINDTESKNLRTLIITI
jgi:hypothetical protein